MKTFRIVVPVVAFLFAIVSAFAFSKPSFVADTAWGKVSGICQQGEIIEPLSGEIEDCDGNEVTCKVRIGTEETEAFESQPLCNQGTAVLMYNN